MTVRPDHGVVVMAVCYKAGEDQRGEQQGGNSPVDSKDTHSRPETNSGASVWANMRTEPRNHLEKEAD